MPSFGPNLDDPDQFVKRAGVPILDVHTRGDRHVDAGKLRLIAENSNARAIAGDPALILLGHTDDGPEAQQPPLVGYAKNYAMGEHEGRPCIVVDFYLRRDRPQAFDFPRRSVEVYYSDSQPAQNYIDAVALLKRSPERDLGLLTYQKRGTVKERYSMADASTAGGITAEDIPALKDFMARSGVTDWAAGMKSFLEAKAAGTADPDPDGFEKGDIEKMAKWAKANKIDLTKPGQYEANLQRYKRERNAGTLHRT